MRHRLARRLARKYRAVSNDPPVQAADGDVTVKLKSAIAGLRDTAGTDAAIHEMCDGVENLLRQGWIVREGGGEATMQKRWALSPEWQGREPPEK
jgi:hypothetical protein